MKDDNNLDVLTAIVTALQKLEPDAQKRTLQAVITYLDISWTQSSTSSKPTEPSVNARSGVSFSENRDISAKDFLRDKLPRTDVERIACLAYYLTHYRNLQSFKTLDLSTVNTEAAQPKFSNAAKAVSNAARARLIVQAAKGTHQLSAIGEVFVQALPNREAAKSSLENMRVRKRHKKTSSKSQPRPQP